MNYRNEFESFLRTMAHNAIGEKGADIGKVAMAKFWGVGHADEAGFMSAMAVLEHPHRKTIKEYLDSQHRDKSGWEAAKGRMKVNTFKLIITSIPDMNNRTATLKEFAGLDTDEDRDDYFRTITQSPQHLKHLANFMSGRIKEFRKKYPELFKSISESVSDTQLVKNAQKWFDEKADRAIAKKKAWRSVCFPRRWIHFFTGYLGLKEKEINRELMEIRKKKAEQAKETTGKELKEKRVRFRLEAPGASAVVLCGDFTSWEKSPIALEKDKKGVWSVSVFLHGGAYQYRFKVDGEWINDPNAKTVPNQYGSENNLIEVF